MLWIIGIAFVAAITAMGMIGGQKNKATRRFGIPGLAFVAGLFFGLGWRAVAILLFIPTLVMGYGEKSVLMGILHNDMLVRIAYGMCLAFPFIFFGWIRFVIALLALPIAFSIHLGSFGSIGGFDFLGEDAVRYSVLAVLIFVLMFVWRKK